MPENDMPEPRIPLKPMEGVAPLGASDLDCLLEIRAVLERCGKLDRFGVTLLHEHFPMRPSEVLLETSDPDLRTMNLSATEVDPDDPDLVDTSWYLGSTIPLAMVKCRTSWHR